MLAAIRRVKIEEAPRAGPVRDGVGRLTNLAWTVDRAVVSEATGASTVAVLNDLQAQGHAVDHLTAEVLDENEGKVALPPMLPRLDMTEPKCPSIVLPMFSM